MPSFSTDICLQLGVGLYGQELATSLHRFLFKVQMSHHNKLFSAFISKQCEEVKTRHFVHFSYRWFNVARLKGLNWKKRGKPKITFHCEPVAQHKTLSGLSVHTNKSETCCNMTLKELHSIALLFWFNIVTILLFLTKTQIPPQKTAS